MNDPKKYTKFKLGSMNVGVSANDDSYSDYLNWYFASVLSETDDNNLNVVIDVKWVEKIKFQAKEYGIDTVIDKIGGNTHFSDNFISTYRKINRKTKVQFDAIFKDEVLYVYIQIQQKKYKKILNKFRNQNKRDQHLFELSFPFIYYPSFWYAQTVLGQYVLHASAVEQMDSGVVLCGLEGIGKTSLGLGLLTENSKFLSDNIVFYDDSKVIACHEMMRLGKDTKENLWKNKFHKISRGKELKDFFIANDEVRANQVEPSILLLPYFSSEFKVSRISAQKAADCCINLSFLASELNNYREYRNFYNILLDGNIKTDAQGTLAKLLASKPCFMVGLPKKDGLELNIERVLKLVTDET